MPDHLQFAAFFNDKLKEHGVSLKRLSEVSGITLKHLESLREGRLHELPPAPYLRGYLKKLGAILDFDASHWWEELKREQEVAQSGPQDRLPENRFIEKPVQRYVWVLGLLLILLVYFLIRLPDIIGKPDLTVTIPSESFVQVPVDEITLQGRLEGATSLTINKETVRIGEDGIWRRNLMLQEGINTVEIRAKKFLGREVQTIRQIEYTPPPEEQEFFQTPQ